MKADFGQEKISSLVFADYNPRTISVKAMTALKNSLREFGLAQPIVVNRRNRVIVGGEQRCRAAIALGWAEVPVARVDLDPAQEKATNVALNSLEMQGEFDQVKLRELVDSVCLTAADLTENVDADLVVAAGWFGLSLGTVRALKAGVTRARKAA